MKTKTVKAWAIIDNRKNKLCHADAVGTERNVLEFAAVFFRKPDIRKWNLGPWKKYKVIIPISITYEIPS